MKRNDMRTITFFSSLALALALTTACKNVEKKRRGDEPTESAKPAATTETPTPAAPTNPHENNPAHMPPAAARAPSVGPTAADGTKSIGAFSIVVPKAWKESPPAGSMRLAQWSIGERDPGELTLISFPGGGAIDTNIDRWIGQFEQEDGSSSRDKAVRKDLTIGEFPVTTLSIAGRYVAAVMPGEAAKHNAADYKMLAAIVTVSGVMYFFKMVGPKATLDANEKDWDAMVSSIKKI